MNQKKLEEVIKKRVDYLDQLYDLEDDWVGPNNDSKAPSKYAIEEAKGFLYAIWDASKGTDNIKAIKVSPKPMGGVGICIEKFSDEHVCDNHDYFFANHGEVYKALNACDDKWANTGEMDFSAPQEDQEPPVPPTRW